MRSLSLSQLNQVESPTLLSGAQLYAELWTSLASLLRSYTAMYGLTSTRQAVVDLGSEKIIVRVDEKWLILTRNHQTVNWTRENGKSGSLELSEDGAFRSAGGDQAMDVAVEHWARELMQ
ncbi:MAG: transcriptional regulator [Terracidiphilus sp.]